MSELSDFVTEAFEDHLNFLSVDVAFNVVTIKAIPAEAEIMPDLDLGGVSDEADGAVICKKVDLLSPLPKAGERMTIIAADGEKECRVATLRESAGNPLVVVEYIGITER